MLVFSVNLKDIMESIALTEDKEVDLRYMDSDDYSDDLEDLFKDF